MKIKKHRQRKHNVTCVHGRTAEFYDGLSRKEEKAACANGKERERERKERRFVRYATRNLYSHCTVSLQ